MKNYITLDELLREAPSSFDGAAKVKDAVGQQAQPDQEFELPLELLELLKEKERIENQLNALAGRAEPELDDVRHELCFPVKIHTKESRIEERRLKHRDERQRVMRQRALEQKIIAKRQMLAELEAKEQARQRSMEIRRVELQRRQKQQALLELLQRRQREQEQIKSRLDKRQRAAALSLAKKRREQVRVEEEALFLKKAVLEQQRLGNIKDEIDWAERLDELNRIAAEKLRARLDEQRQAENLLDRRREIALQRRAEKLEAYRELDRRNPARL